MSDLCDKHARFVEEYLIDLNGKQAAIRAGYSPRSAEVTASKMLRNAKVSCAISKAMAERSKRIGINQERVLRELARIGFAKAKDIIDDYDGTLKKDISDDDAAAVQSIRVRQLPEGCVEREVKLYDKQKPLELLYKHLGGAPDRIDITTNGKAIDGGTTQVLVVPAVLEEDAWEKLATEDDNGES